MKPLIVITLLFAAFAAKAQITAQGQGGKLALWTALGAEQQIGKRWTNKNAIAYSRHSQLDNNSMLQQSGIFTVREELIYKISKNFKFSQGVFYAERSYYDREHPDYLNEIRLYPRVYHEFAIGKVKFSQYLRCDFRFFTSPGFHEWQKPFEFRNRYLMKATVPLTKGNKNQLILITEFFAATDRLEKPDGSVSYTSYQFTENRSSLYLRHKFEHPDMFFDIGVMNQEWMNSNHLQETILVEMDLIFINPFRRLQR